jgi:uncharacterized protein YecT (DUF1311 family)
LFSHTKTKTSAWLTAIAGVFLFAAQANAQSGIEARYSDEYQSCNSGQTKAMVECVDALTRKWDQRLNAAYGIAMNILPAPRRQALQAVQRNWVQYRDINCRWYAGGEGTIARVETTECMRSMTAARAVELEWIIQR